MSVHAAALARYQSRIEEALDRRLPGADLVPERLHAAVRYSTLGGGKRIRAALVYATGELLGAEAQALDAAAAAVEMIHAYSLIHDDLPAMDNDDLRRGRPTCHRAFDEATAILAGDALQVLAFESLAEAPCDATHRIATVGILARASGTHGMAGGQAIDLASVGRTLGAAEVEQMHRYKTGALLEASVALGIALAGRTGSDEAANLIRYARAIGFAFQIVDDLLDIEGDPSLLGKTTGADLARGKPTYPAAVGLAAARARADELMAEAGSALAPFGDRAGMLHWLGEYIVHRRS
jgi:geranylgeranyl pyrophosphate synthase